MNIISAESELEGQKDSDESDGESGEESDSEESVEEGSESEDMMSDDDIKMEKRTNNESGKS